MWPPLKIFKLLYNHINVSIIVTNLINPEGYGRIIKDNKNNFLKIVEEKDCNDMEKKVETINSGIYLFNSILLDKYLTKIRIQYTIGTQWAKQYSIEMK